MITRVLIANRAEIAIRIARASAELGIGSVALYSADDATSLHVVKADRAERLPGSGASAYLDAEAIIAAALATNCDAIHPGYGFLSENEGFARRCAAAGLVFVGPSPDVLHLFGDKAKARARAQQSGVPVAAGTAGPTSLAEARAFFTSLGPGGAMMIKAVVGGGGRGMRIVRDGAALDEAWQRCSSEARAAFGADAVYVEDLIPRARHIEVQVVGDHKGGVIHLFERECSAQRRHQKLVEIAPSPWLAPALRDVLTRAALQLTRAVHYDGVGTVEFLVEVDAAGEATGRFVFIEMNPRLQVEHTVTEEVTGIDLVKTQLQLASGMGLAELGLDQNAIEAPRGYAIQLRVNMETLAADGSTRSSGGTLAAFDQPSGTGVRVETCGYQGYATHPGFDPLLAKVVAHSSSPRFTDVLTRAYRALCEFRIEGVATNLGVLQNLLMHPDFAAGRVDTRFVENHAAELAAIEPGRHPSLHARSEASHDAGIAEPGQTEAGPAGTVAITAPMQGRLISLEVREGDLVRLGQNVAVIEAMKMEHVVVAETSGTVTRVAVAAGDGVRTGTPLLYLMPHEVEADDDDAEAAEPGDMSENLVALQQRQAELLDSARPKAVERQRKRNALTARERIAMLCDAGTFCEIGGLVRVENLGAEALADGLVIGTGCVDGRSVVVASQDFTVFGGSVGHLGGSKMMRAVALALAHGKPLVMLLDGGGHRIQEGQNSRSFAHAGGLFHDFARLSGWVPVVGAMLGAGFAGNTNFTGMADFVVMLRGRATMGLAGPALVKAGTGETITAQALGGADVQVNRYGLADLGVDSEEAAIGAVKRFLSYLPDNSRGQSPLKMRQAADDEEARAEALLHVVPANTRKTYDVRHVISLVADADSLFELKPAFARNIVTAFARLDGRAVGFIANQAMVLGGMLDSPACDKGAHFVALCDAFGLPLIYLIDIPGFSIGSEAERSTLGRRSAKLLYELGHATVPRISVVLRKGYGLGYLAMGGGRSFDADAAFAWPTAEICAMSVEGSVDVAYRQDYASAADPIARRQELIDSIRSVIGPLQAAEGFGIDDLIDPRTTRRRLIEVLARAPVRRDNKMPAKYRSIAPI